MKAKAPTSNTNLLFSPEDTERQYKLAANISSIRPRADSLIKADDDTKKKSRPFLSQIFSPVFLKDIQQTQREVEGASIQDNDSAPYYDFDYGSNAGFR
ncbi:hypothetical protein Tco_0683283 [Tanacetum coccineum]|uniref:Uncharacterized protein n=1 Tax=Tanacetum coccineum TaxID=301880 RepID=A0ABQ4XVG2_9ASTR